MMNESGNDHHHIDDDYHEMASTASNSSVVDTIVNAAQVCNSLVSEYCGLCTFYIDQQVQYELISNVASREPSSATFDLNEEYFGRRSKTARNATNAALQLFDEESVVESVTSR